MKDAAGGSVTCLNEAAAKGTPVSVGRKASACYMHVDGGTFISSDQQVDNVHSDKLLHSCVDDLKTLGFVVNDVREHGQTDRVVGYAPHSSRARLAIPEDKQALLYASMSALLRLTVVPIDIISGILRVWIWASLLNRDLLAVPCHIFGFVHHYSHRGSAPGGLL